MLHSRTQVLYSSALDVQNFKLSDKLAYSYMLQIQHFLNYSSPNYLVWSLMRSFDHTILVFKCLSHKLLTEKSWGWIEVITFWNYSTCNCVMYLGSRVNQRCAIYCKSVVFPYNACICKVQRLSISQIQNTIEYWKIREVWFRFTIILDWRFSHDSGMPNGASIMDTMTHPNSHLFKFWQRR